MTRNEMLTWLIERDIFYITHLDKKLLWVREILLNGFDGYKDRSYHDLRAEILETDPDAFKENQDA